jgi:hypothetical protein
VCHYAKCRNAVIMQGVACCYWHAMNDDSWCHYAECRYAECHYAECHANCHYAECRYAECHYAECHYAECHDAECRFAECRVVDALCLQISESAAPVENIWSLFYKTFYIRYLQIFCIR